MCRRLLGLRKRLTELNEEIDIAEAQLSTLNNDVEYKRKEKEIDKLCCRYDETKAKIQGIEAQPEVNKSTENLATFRSSKESNKKKLIDIDYCEPKNVFEVISKKVKESGGAAAFLLNEAYRLQGDVLTQHIEDTLTTQCQDIQSFPIEFAPGEPKNQEALLSKILGYLGESEPANPEQAIAKICQSLQIGSIRVFKIYNWDELQDPYDVLKWFLDRFWLPLIDGCQRHCQIEKLVKVQLFALIICQSNDPNILKQPYYAEHDTYNPCQVSREKSLIYLPLSCWTEAEIKNWMCHFTPPKYTKNFTAIEDLARRFYRRTEGVPVNVVDLILEEYQKMEAE